MKIYDKPTCISKLLWCYLSLQSRGKLGAVSNNDGQGGTDGESSGGYGYKGRDLQCWISH